MSNVAAAAARAACSGKITLGRHDSIEFSDECAISHPALFAPLPPSSLAIDNDFQLIDPPKPPLASTGDSAVSSAGESPEVGLEAFQFMIASDGYLSSSIQTEEQTPLNAEILAEWRDTSGRITDERALCEYVFKNGCVSELRPLVWPFLFGVFQTHASVTERQSTLESLTARYLSLRERWRKVLLDRYSTFDLTRCDNCIVEQNEMSPRKPMFQVEDDAAAPGTSQQKPEVPTSFASIEAQAYAQRFACDLTKLEDAVRFISRDVPRTDRHLKEFSEMNSPLLLQLRDTLTTFAFMHPETGYVQGMNDIMARLLVVMKSEVLAFWSFVNYVRRSNSKFTARGMARKIAILKALLKDLDSDLCSHLTTCGSSNMAFCHRWLLLDFLREFDYESATRLFETLNTHYMENTFGFGRRKSLCAYQSHMQESRALHSIATDAECTFDLFVAAAMLILHRKRFLLECEDVSQVFQTATSLTGKMSLRVVLQKAEELYQLFSKQRLTEQASVL